MINRFVPFRRLAQSALLALAAVLAAIFAASGIAVAEDRAGPDATADRPLLMAQAEIPLPRPRPLVREPSTLSITGQPGTTPLDLLKGLDMSATGAFEQDQEEVVRPTRQLHLSARLTEGSENLGTGLKWRVYRVQPALDGTFELVEESKAASPVFKLPADDYIVHVAYGLANTATRVSLVDGPAEQQMDLNAGGLRLTPLGVLEETLSDRDVMLSVYSSEQDEYGQRKLLVESAPASTIIRLNSGTYHIVSRFGDANSVMRADVRVQAGKLTDATIHHRAAEITLKLVNEAGGEALANTAWSILSPGGDVVKESYGAFPSHVLAAGEYSVVARHDGNLYSREFVVEPGRDSEVELIAQ